MLESHRDAILRGRMSYVHAYYAANVNIIFASHLPWAEKNSPNIWINYLNCEG